MTLGPSPLRGETIGELEYVAVHTFMEAEVRLSHGAPHPGLRAGKAQAANSWPECQVQANSTGVGHGVLDFHSFNVFKIIDKPKCLPRDEKEAVETEK